MDNKRNDKQLVINILGEAGSGKTIMAAKLMEFLNREGFNDVQFDDKTEEAEMTATYYINNQQICWDSIKSNSIKIQTTQAMDMRL